VKRLIMRMSENGSDNVLVDGQDQSNQVGNGMMGKIEEAGIEKETLDQIPHGRLKDHLIMEAGFEKTSKKSRIEFIERMDTFLGTLPETEISKLRESKDGAFYSRVVRRYKKRVIISRDGLFWKLN